MYILLLKDLTYYFASFTGFLIYPKIRAVTIEPRAIDTRYITGFVTTGITNNPP